MAIGRCGVTSPTSQQKTMEIPEFLSQKKIVFGKFGQKVPLFVLSFPLDDAFVVCVFHKNEKKGEANIFV